MRIFPTRWTQRFVRREGMDAANLVEAVARAERGLVDADLGGGLIDAGCPLRARPLWWFSHHAGVQER